MFRPPLPRYTHRESQSSNGTEFARQLGVGFVEVAIQLAFLGALAVGGTIFMAVSDAFQPSKRKIEAFRRRVLDDIRLVASRSSIRWKIKEVGAELPDDDSLAEILKQARIEPSKIAVFTLTGPSERQPIAVIVHVDARSMTDRTVVELRAIRNALRDYLHAVVPGVERRKTCVGVVKFAQGPSLQCLYDPEDRSLHDVEAGTEGLTRFLVDESGFVHVSRPQSEDVD